jgi:hypothetical protein
MVAYTLKENEMKVNGMIVLDKQEEVVHGTSNWI